MKREKLNIIIVLVLKIIVVGSVVGTLRLETQWPQDYYYYEFYFQNVHVLQAQRIYTGWAHKGDHNKGLNRNFCSHEIFERVEEFAENHIIYNIWRN